MQLRSHRRLVVLFIAAILVPCSVLVALSVRMIRQERELAERRLEEERHNLTARIRQELLARLERIKLQETTILATEARDRAAGSYRHPATLLLARVEANRLVLPWDHLTAAQRLATLPARGEFTRYLREAERAELADRRFAAAAEFYQQALQLAESPAQHALTHLYLARVLKKLGKKLEAVQHYKQVLALGDEVIDEYGIPVKLYAAGQLLEERREAGGIATCLNNLLENRQALPPAAAYMVRDIAARLYTQQ